MEGDTGVDRLRTFRGSAALHNWPLWGIWSSGSQGPGGHRGSWGQPRGAVLPVAVGRGDPTRASAPLCPPGLYPLTPASSSTISRAGCLQGSPLRPGSLQPAPARRGLQEQPLCLRGRCPGAACSVSVGPAPFTCAHCCSRAWARAGASLAPGPATVAMVRVRTSKRRQRDKQSLGTKTSRK